MRDHLFGKLRSLLHTSAPRGAVWRCLVHALHTAEAAQRQHELVPYLDALLDQRWPDAQRPASLGWIKRLEQTGQPHHGWPLARALRAWTPPDAAHPLLAGDHLRRITHLSAEGCDATRLHLLLEAPALGALTSFDGATWPISHESLNHLLTRRPALRSLTLGACRAEALPAPKLPALRALDITRVQTTPRALRALLDAEALPALEALKVRAAQALEESLASRLSALELYATDRAALDTLRTLPHIERLRVEALLDEAAIDAITRASAAPRALTLANQRHATISRPPRRAPRMMERVEELELLRIHDDGLTLAALLDGGARQTLQSLRITTHGALSLHALAREPWPKLERLSLTRAGTYDLGRDVGAVHRAFPALRHLELRCCSALTDADLAALTSAPWFSQLETIDLNSSYHAAWQRAEHPLIEALDGHPALVHLGLCGAGLSSQHIKRLASLDLPALKIARLGKVRGMSYEQIDAIGESSWLRQLDHLRLIVRDTSRWRRWDSEPEPLRYVNLHARLIHAGLPPRARVNY